MSENDLWHFFYQNVVLCSSGLVYILMHFKLLLYTLHVRIWGTEKTPIFKEKNCIHDIQFQIISLH